MKYLEELPECGIEMQGSNCCWENGASRLEAGLPQTFSWWKNGIYEERRWCALKQGCLHIIFSRVFLRTDVELVDQVLATCSHFPKIGKFLHFSFFFSCFLKDFWVVLVFISGCPLGKSMVEEALGYNITLLNIFLALWVSVRTCDFFS